MLLLGRDAPLPSSFTILRLLRPVLYATIDEPGLSLKLNSSEPGLAVDAPEPGIRLSRHDESCIRMAELSYVAYALDIDSMFDSNVRQLCICVGDSVGVAEDVGVQRH